MTVSVKNNLDQTTSGFDQHGRIGLMREFGRALVQLVLLLVSAGTLYWVNAWIYTGLILIFTLINTIILLKMNPQLINERGKGFKPGTKPFDKSLLISIFLLLYITLIIAGLDARRYGWSDMSVMENLLGGAFLVFGFILILWAMIANTHFEGTVRIQDDRNHKVCSSGPYGIVRHPGYAGIISGTLGTPLILGSRWGFVPAIAAVFLIILRTLLEDNVLQNELSGYLEHAKRTRYRLVPFMW